MKKGGNNGSGGSSFACVAAICLFAVLFGCQAWPAQCRSSSHQPIKHQQQSSSRHIITTGLYLNASSSQANGDGGYQTKIECPAAAAAGGDDDYKGTKKLTLIFCTVKCYCHGNHEVCYCCQLSGSGGPVCYDHLSDCQANCPICNPKCPPAPPGSSFA